MSERERVCVCFCQDAERGKENSLFPILHLTSDTQYVILSLSS